MLTPITAGLLLLASCRDKETDTAPAAPQDTADSGTPTDTADTADSEEPTIPDGLIGTIDFHTFGEYAEVNIQKAFALAVDKKIIAYFSNNKDATCEDAIGYATPSNKAEDPSDFLVSGHCDMFMSLPWDGGFDHKNDLLYVAGFSMICPLGDGEFVYEERDDDDDYYWSGRWWQGHPEDYEITIEETTDGYTFTGNLTTYKGSLIYEELATYTGVGQVWGVLPVERCDAMKSLHEIY